MTKNECMSILLATLLSVGMLQDVEAAILRPNIRTRAKMPTQQEIEIQGNSAGKQPVVSTKPVPQTNKSAAEETKTNAESANKTISVEEIRKRFAQISKDYSENAEEETAVTEKVKADSKTSAKKQIAPVIAETEETKQLDVELAGMLGDKGTQVPGIGVIAYKNGEKVYQNSMGRRYIWGDKTGDLPFAVDSRFRVGTISQQMVALATLQLAGQGGLDIDEDISKYLGFNLRNPNNSNVKITARMLMCHTSSLRDAQYGFDQSWKDIFVNGKEFFANKDQKPGVYFHYANINYRILATVLEKVSGTRFDLFMKNGILKDLNIKGSYNITDFKPKEQKLLGGIYQKQKDGVWDEDGSWILQMDDYVLLKGHKNTEFILQPIEPGKEMWTNLLNYEVGKNASIFVPECGLRASLDELSHVLEMIFAQGIYMNKQVIDNKMLDEMFKIHWVYDDWDKNGETYGGIFEAYGYGVMPYMNGSTTRLTTVKSHQWWGQIGDNYGVVSGLVIDRRTKSGYVYLANGQAMNWTDARSRGKYSKHIIWQENINDAICRNLFKD